jgi:hypothetical protein
MPAYVPIAEYAAPEAQLTSIEVVTDAGLATSNSINTALNTTTTSLATTVARERLITNPFLGGAG